jgi:hypothetical protein
MLRCGHVPKIPYTATGTSAEYRPDDGGSPAKYAYAIDCGTTTAESVMPADRSDKKLVRE